MYFGRNFEECVAEYTDIMMREHQEADAMSEESFRNCKTVASLGARDKFYNLYDTIVMVDCGSHL